MIFNNNRRFYQELILLHTIAHMCMTSLLAKRTRFRAAGTLQSLGFVSEDKSALEGFYRDAWRIAKKKKPHTIGERLMKPCAMDMVEFVCAKEQKKKKLRKFLCQTVQYVIVSDMSQDILDHVAEEIWAS